jgi:hypothetical protein
MAFIGFNTLVIFWSNRGSKEVKAGRIYKERQALKDSRYPRAS